MYFLFHHGLFLLVFVVVTLTIEGDRDLINFYIRYTLLNDTNRLGRQGLLPALSHYHGARQFLPLIGGTQASMKVSLVGIPATLKLLRMLLDQP